MKTLRFTPVAAVAVTAVLGISNLLAQDGPPPEEMPLPPAVPSQNGPGGGPAGAPPTTSGTVPAAPGDPGRGPGNRDAFRQRMAERLKTALKASDEEWAVIQPLLEKVMQKQHDLMMNRMGGLFSMDRRGNRGGGNGPEANNPPPNRPARPNQPEVEALRTALDNDAASNEDIKAKLETIRAARKKAQSELDAASEDLRKVLTLKQEALLVMMGILQ